MAIVFAGAWMNLRPRIHRVPATVGKILMISAPLFDERVGNFLSKVGLLRRCRKMKKVRRYFLLKCFLRNGIGGGKNKQAFFQIGGGLRIFPMSQFQAMGQNHQTSVYYVPEKK